MNKYEFLQALAHSLKDYRQTEIDGVLNYYNEIISDRIESGIDEYRVVSELGDIKNITRQIRAELVEERLKNNIYSPSDNVSDYNGYGNVGSQNPPHSTPNKAFISNQKTQRQAFVDNRNIPSNNPNNIYNGYNGDNSYQNNFSSYNPQSYNAKPEPQFNNYNNQNRPQGDAFNNQYNVQQQYQTNQSNNINNQPQPQVNQYRPVPQQNYRNNYVNTNNSKPKKGRSTTLLLFRLFLTPAMLPLGIVFFALIFAACAVQLSLVVGFSVAIITLLASIVPVIIAWVGQSVGVAVLFTGGILITAGVLGVLTLVIAKCGTKIIKLLFKMVAACAKKIYGGKK